MRLTLNTVTLSDKGELNRIFMTMTYADCTGGAQIRNSVSVEFFSVSCQGYK